MSEYFLAGNRKGFDAMNNLRLTRVDLPPNAGGFCYTEFRDSKGALEAVYLTALLPPTP